MEQSLSDRKKIKKTVAEGPTPHMRHHTYQLDTREEVLLRLRGLLLRLLQRPLCLLLLLDKQLLRGGMPVVQQGVAAASLGWANLHTPAGCSPQA